MSIRYTSLLLCILFVRNNCKSSFSSRGASLSRSIASKTSFTSPSKASSIFSSKASSISSSKSVPIFYSSGTNRYGSHNSIFNNNLNRPASSGIFSNKMLVGAGVGSISGYSVGSSHRRYYDNNVNSNGNVETEVPHTFFYDNTMFSFINEDFYYDGYLLDTKCEKSLSELIEEEKNFSSNTNNTSTDSINGNILESNEQIDPSDGLNSLPKIENATIPTSLDRTFDNSNETLYWTNLRFPNGSVPNTIFWGCRYQEICCTDKKCCAQDLGK